MIKEKLLLPPIRCASDRGGVVAFGNSQFQYYARFTSFGDGTMTVKVIDELEWDMLRKSEKTYDWQHTKNLGFLERHFYLYERDCSNGDPKSRLLDINGCVYAEDHVIYVLQDADMERYSIYKLICGK